jgi:two-component system, OmpR family, osmolarity sensor histidine kinase EnvZ
VPDSLVKRILPRSLFGRALLIIVMPLILLQVISTWFFYDRHWETVTRRLTGAVAGELAVAIDQLDQGKGKPAATQSKLDALGAPLAIRLDYRPGAILPNTGLDRGSGLLHRLLRRELTAYLRRPVYIDTDYRPREVLVRVQLQDGVLDAEINRERLFTSTTYIFVLWMVGTSLVLFAVASLFMRNQVRPIRRLARAMDRFGKGREVGDFKPSGASEVRQAASAFNAMRDSIQRMITQRTEMLAGVSHDLRTPLTRMKLQLAMPDASDVEALRSDIAEMERMLAEYLAFARGEGTEAACPTDLGEVLAEVVDGARRQGASVELRCAGALAVTAKPNALKRCLANVVDNAIGHARHVAVAAARRDGAIEITIDDDGPGIPADQREAVFRPFYRMESSRSRETGGTGLGLTIARDVIRSHGGDIALDDSPMGGLRARLRLPE